MRFAYVRFSLICERTASASACWDLAPLLFPPVGAPPVLVVGASLASGLAATATTARKVVCVSHDRANRFRLTAGGLI
jgi:hypothetical protein